MGDDPRPEVAPLGSAWKQRMPTPTETIAANLQKPQSVNIDGNSATQHPLGSQVEAAKFVQASGLMRTTSHPVYALRFVKLRFPGGA